MKKLSIVGGVYQEFCVQPGRRLVYGSAGRAAHCVSELLDGNLELHTYVGKNIESAVTELADGSRAKLIPTPIGKALEFAYFHPLSVPAIWPDREKLIPEPPIRVSGDVVLRYGMLEGDAIVDAEVAIYDPQSAFGAKRFGENGSTARKLAVVLNTGEARSMLNLGPSDDVVSALREMSEASVIVLKRGSQGALVLQGDMQTRIPVYPTTNVWKIGSGDVFSSTFAALWGCLGYDPVKAADVASRATASYCETEALPPPSPSDLLGQNRHQIYSRAGKIYLAGPFFDVGQRWLVEEIRDQFRDMGVSVFSPIHDVGGGDGKDVAPQDLEGLKSCDLVYAILNGLDPGTIFEVGYAVKAGIPVVALAQNIPAEDLKMFEGTQCEIVTDFVTSIYRAVWKLPAAKPQ